MEGRKGRNHRHAQRKIGLEKVAEDVGQGATGAGSDDEKTHSKSPMIYPRREGREEGKIQPNTQRKGVSEKRVA
jgi:hypothetical protein